MADAAAEQYQRLLRLLPILADGKAHRLPMVAKRAGVPIETVIADLRDVVTRDEDIAGHVSALQVSLGPDSASVVSQPFRRPMRLTGRELAALELGLALLQRETPPEERQVIDRTRTRIRETILKLAAGDGVLPSVSELGPEVDVGQLATLRKAVIGQRPVRITYQGSGQVRPRDRTVNPYALIPHAAAWYLIAHCKEVAAVRVFRLDRIQQLRALEGRFFISKDFQLDSVLRDGRIFMAKGTATVKIRYSAKVARWITEREHVSPAEDGSVTVEYPLADPAWAIRHVLQYGREAEVLGPPTLRAAIYELVTGGGARGNRARARAG